jgi:O-antigen ligase
MYPVLIAAAVLVLPFIHSQHTLDFDLAPKFLGLAVLAACLQAYLCFRRAAPDRAAAGVHPVAWILAGYGLVSLVAIPSAANLPEAVYEVAKTALMCILLFQAMHFMAARGIVQARTLLVKAMIVFTVAAACMGFVEARSRLGDGYTLDAIYAITGTFGHKNFFSSILFFSLSFCLYGVLRFRGAWLVAASGSLVSGLSIIAMLQTRSVWCALAASALGGPLLALVRPPKSPGTPSASWLRKGPILICCGAVLLAGSTIVLGPKPAHGIRERVVSVFDPAKNMWRLLIWRKSLAMASDHPWIGVGPGNWKIVFPSYGIEDIRIVGGEVKGKETQFVRPHNDFLWAFCETGVPGGVLYLGFFLGLILVCIRMRQRGMDVEERTYALCMFMGLGGYMVDASFSFPRERIGHSVFLMLAAASLLVRDRENKSAGILVSGNMRTWAPWGALGAMIPILALGWIRLTSELKMREALEARAEGRWETVISGISAVDRRIYSLDPFVNPVTFYRGTAYFLLGDRIRAQADFEEALARHPFHAHSLNNLATCMQLSGNPEMAIEYYRRALRIRPAMEDAWLNGASVLFNQGRYRESEEWLSNVPVATPNPRRQALSRLLTEKKREKK